MYSYDDWSDSEIAEEISRALNSECREVGKTTLRELLQQIKQRIMDKPLPVADPSDVMEESTAV